MLKEKNLSQSPLKEKDDLTSQLKDAELEQVCGGNYEELTEQPRLLVAKNSSGDRIDI